MIRREQYAQRLVALEDTSLKAQATLKDAAQGCQQLFQALVDRTAALLAGRLPLQPPPNHPATTGSASADADAAAALLAPSIAAGMLAGGVAAQKRDAGGAAWSLLEAALAAPAAQAAAKRPPTPGGKGTAGGGGQGGGGQGGGGGGGAVDRAAVLSAMNDRCGIGENTRLVRAERSWVGCRGKHVISAGALRRWRAALAVRRHPHLWTLCGWNTRASLLLSLAFLLHAQTRTPRHALLLNHLRSQRRAPRLLLVPPPPQTHSRNHGSPCTRRLSATRTACHAAAQGWLTIHPPNHARHATHPHTPAG